MHRLSGITTRAVAAGAAFALSLAASAGNVHEVTQVGFTFDPDVVTVQPGDTVLWQWTAGFHTVTSGADCVYDGKFFDEPLDPSQEVVLFTVPDDFSGEIPYFCDPHCMFGMTGTIIVEGAAACPADFDGTGDVGFTDLIVVLSTWGLCEPGEGCDADLDGSGDVGFADLIQVLTAWGPCP